jgi:hypothetical protein
MQVARGDPHDDHDRQQGENGGGDHDRLKDRNQYADRGRFDYLTSGLTRTTRQG